jgi:hypothetical protein
VFFFLGTTRLLAKGSAHTGGILLLAAVWLLTGCLERPHLNIQSFTFGLPTTQEAPVLPGAPVLGIRTLQVAVPFDSRFLVYRTGEFSYKHDPYAEFLVSPVEDLALPIRGWMRNSGAFSAVAESNSALWPNLVAEISVNELYGDFRQSEHAAAVLAIHFVFLRAINGAIEKVIFEKSYAQSIPLKARTASALMEGWNEALLQILAEVVSDLKRSNGEVLGLVPPT